jgi:hypothetical protein
MRITPARSATSLVAAALLAVATLFAAALTTISPATAQDADKRGFDVTAETIKGTWSIETRDAGTYLVLHDDFRTTSGPDLKVFLSKQNVNDVRDANATRDAIKLGPLQKARGGQSYKLPDDVTVSDFTSILIHCERYSHFWGGANL